MDCKERILSNDYVDLLVDFSLDWESALEDEGNDFCMIPVNENQGVVYTRRISRGEMALDVYSYRYQPNLYGLMQDDFNALSLDAGGITAVQRPPLSLTGRGIIMAFIDTGIDYTDRVFRDSEGNTRILSIWDQTIQSGTPPEGFYYGSEYGREEIQRALQSDDPYAIVPSRDEIGHGTAMASVAAGSSIDGGRTFLGAAPDTDIVVVKMKECKPYLRDFYLIADDAAAYAENDIMLAVKYVLGFLKAFERPVILCLGLGSNWGDHTGFSPLSRYLNEAAVKRSMGLVVCGGNEGNAGHHFQGRLQTGVGGNNNYQDAEIRVGEGEKGFFMEIWGSIPDTFQVHIFSPGGESVTGNLLGLGQSVTYRFIFERTRVSIYNILVEESAGEQLILLRFSEPTAGIWRVRVTASGTVQNGAFNIWLPITQFLSSETYFLEASPNITLTEPSLAGNVITISAYNDVNNSFYAASGRGFSRDNRIKPDLAAPGVNIPTLEGTETGSSMAASITAGAAALFMQWAVLRGNRPFVTSLEIRNYMIRGASRMPGTTYPNREWGYGRLNLAGTFEALAGI